MATRARPRLEKALQTEDGSAADAMNLLIESVPDLMSGWIEQAPDNPQIAAMLLRVISDDMTRAKRGRNDELLQSLAKIRESGSDILALTWSRCAKVALGLEFLGTDQINPVPKPKKSWWLAGDSQLPRTLPVIPDVQIPFTPPDLNA